MTYISTWNALRSMLHAPFSIPGWRVIHPHNAPKHIYNYSKLHAIAVKYRALYFTLMILKNLENSWSPYENNVTTSFSLRIS